MTSVIYTRCARAFISVYQGGYKHAYFRAAGSHLNKLERNYHQKMVKTQKFTLSKAFEGEPKESDFKLTEEELPAVKEGEYLWEALFWSVDPYMRPRAVPGQLMLGSCVVKVLESKHKDYAAGDLVMGYFGWQTRNVQHGDKEAGGSKPYKLPSFAPLSPSLALGVLGMPGNTAYFGFTEICQPKEGETVVVNCAAGAVGTHVGQIAKIKGCRVIGFAGSDDKVEWLKEEIGFDAAYNYKKIDVSVALQEAAPKGVDCYFDNVGGVMSNKVMEQMNVFGRIAVCGAISSYNDDKATAPVVQRLMIYKNLKMEGFVVTRWGNRWMEGIQQNMQWIKEGKLKFRETVTEGFANMPKAFISMLRGENTGKAIIKA